MTAEQIDDTVQNITVVTHYVLDGAGRSHAPSHVLTAAQVVRALADIQALQTVLDYVVSAPCMPPPRVASALMQLTWRESRQELTRHQEDIRRHLAA